LKSGEIVEVFFEFLDFLNEGREPSLWTEKNKGDADINYS